MDSRIAGIAGQDFLSHFNYLVEYRKHFVRIEQDNEVRNAIDGTPVPMEAGGNRMIVAIEAQSDGAAHLHLLLDSGANSVVLMREAARAVKLANRGNGVEVTISGHLRLEVGTINSLRVGSQRLKNLAAVLSNAEPVEPIGDGLLPTVLFQSLYVNNREGYVVFNPRLRRD
jgi:predicted aspartyl protease